MSVHAGCFESKYYYGSWNRGICQMYGRIRARCGPQPTLRPYRAERAGEVQHGDGDDHSLQQHRQQQQDPELRTGARHDRAAVRHPTSVLVPDFQQRLKQWQGEQSPQVIPSPQLGEEEEAGPENKSSFSSWRRYCFIPALEKHR